MSSSNGINEDGVIGIIEQTSNLVTLYVATEQMEKLQSAINSLAYYAGLLGYSAAFIASATCSATIRGMRQRAMIANGEAHVAPTGEVVETPSA